jgi:O-methyltransferase involved in polyketide biosynthesis
MIPLVARARAAEFGLTQYHRDPTAEKILDRLGTKGDEFMHRPTVEMVEARTRIFVELARSFFEKHPTGTAFNIGCGLSDYFQWLDNGQNHFIDADLAEVMKIREQLIEPRNARHRFAEVSLTSPNWWESLQIPTDEPALILIEGVLMYLKPEDVQAILGAFGEKASKGSELLFDFMSWLGVGQAQRHSPVMKHTKAEFHWGARRISDLTKPHPRLRLLSQHRPLASGGFLRSAGEYLFRAITSVPLYGIARMGVK